MRVSRATLALLIAITGVAGPALLGGTDSGYDAARQYISELGVPGTRTARWASFGIFLPIAILCLVAMPRLSRSPAGMMLLFAISIGNLGAVVFPCDAGCPLTGSRSQLFHNACGLAEYLMGGIASLLPGQPGAPWLNHWLGVGVILCLVFMSLPVMPYRGVIQRTAELCLYFQLIRVSAVPVRD